MRASWRLLFAVPCVLFTHCGGSSQPPDGGDAATDSAPSGEQDGAIDGEQDAAPTEAGNDATVDASGIPVDASADADAGADATVRYIPKAYAVNHVLSTGQSLSVGSQGTPVLSLTQPFDNRMLNTGVLSSATVATSFSPLVEGPTFETMSSGLANLVSDVAGTEVLLGLPPPADKHRVLVSCHGRGGTAYVGLKKGTLPYAAGMAQVQASKAIADAALESYVVRVVTNVHGESDHVAMNANYGQNLVEWQADYEADVRAITGQTDEIPMLHTQMSSWTKYTTATSSIPIQQLEASVASNGKIVMVGPKYAVEYAPDGVHLTSAGYRHMGEYYAKAYRRIVLEGKRWEPLRPSVVTLVGDEVRVKFLVPVPPLVIDTTTVTDPGDFGFEYTDDSGAPPSIVAVTLDGVDVVRIKLSAVPAGATKLIRYAYTGTIGARGGATTGPRGNLRDSDASKSRHGNKLENWAVHFSMPIP